MTMPPPSDMVRAQPIADRAGRRRVHFLLLLAMDLVARTGYQMGKSPVLPLFARALGAGPEVSGVIVAVSTTTGLITTPLIGALSDRYGRCRLLIAGTAMFAFMPFVYLFVQTPGQLLRVCLVYGVELSTWAGTARARTAAIRWVLCLVASCFSMLISAGRCRGSCPLTCSGLVEGSEL